MLIAKKQSTLLPFKFNKYYYKRHPTSHRMPFIVSLHNKFYYLLLSVRISDNMANCSSVNASPLIFSGSPHWIIDSSICSFLKWSSWEFFKPFTNVFLLWLKDARIIRNISFSSFACTGGAWCLVSRITALPTLGLGIKQFGGTFATISGFA